MSKKPQPNLKELQKEWYEKLEKSGFQDIEKDEYNFKTVTHASRFSQEVVARTYEAKSEYYSMCGRFLHEYKFESELERVIFEYHAEAISTRNIAKLLKKVKIIKPNKDNVSQIIKKLVIKMKKMYLYKPEGEQ